MVKFNARAMLRKRKAADGFFMIMQQDDSGKPSSSASSSSSSPPSKRPRLVASRKARRVQFAEAARNEYIENTRMDRDEVKQLWHSKQELKALGEASTQIARELKASEKDSTDPQSWSRSLFRVYRALQRAQTKEQVQLILSSLSNLKLNQNVVGLEGVVVTPIARDFVARRQHVLQQLAWVQSQPSSTNANQRAEDIARTICLESRVSRLYAQILGQAAWQDNTNDDNATTC